MKHSSYRGQIARLISLSLIVVLLMVPSVARAYMATEYTTNTNFPVGTLIALDNRGAPAAASLSTSNYVGSVMSKGQGKIDIANTGTVTLFVSDADGPIVLGSRIGLSAIAGVGTLYQIGRPLVGIAMKGGSDIAAKDWTSAQAQTDDGSRRTVQIAQFPVQLIQDTGSSKAIDVGLMGIIQQAANNLVGHTVSLWQVIASLIIGLGSLILAFGMLVSSGRESFLSLGRNPMASRVILRGMWQLVAVSITVMLLGLVMAYLILRLGS